MYDVIVVGGGLSGSSVGMLLARAGWRVLLAESRSSPGDGTGAVSIGPRGRATLHRWGLLDDVVGSGCPPTTYRMIGVGRAVVSVLNLEVTGSRVSYAPTCGVLVAALDGGARRAGVEIRRGFTVTDLVWERGAVTGTVGHGADRRSHADRAGVVVGADGRHSLVARIAGATSSAERPATGCRYGAMWRGLRAVVPELFCLDGATVEILPCGEDLAWVDVHLAVDAWTAFKRRPEETYLASVGRVPGWMERFAGANRQTRFSGTADLATCHRHAAGRGWALVAEARSHDGMPPGRDAAAYFDDAETTAATISMRLSGGRGRAVGSYEALPDGNGHGVAAIA